MAARAVGLLVFLVLITGLCCSAQSPFKLEQRLLTAVEGSCIEIKCKFTQTISTAYAYWFWLKNGFYNDTMKDFGGTVVFSSDSSERTVSPDYTDRVRYTGSPSDIWYQNFEEKMCSILICNLNKSDSGQYAFRFVTKHSDKKWITNPNVTLTVEKNPCPITFEKPQAVNENSPISLRCSTPSSCTSDLQITGLEQHTHTKTPHNDAKWKSIDIDYSVSWKDDGKEVSCQTSDNLDDYLIKRVNLTVRYSPKEMSATSSMPGGIMKENQPVTLTCSAKGNPNPTITWIKNGQDKYDKAVLNFESIKATESGNYSCEATNTLGELKSKPVSIDVQYMPQVEVKTSPADEVTEGEEITLTCNVIKSNPRVHGYVWFRDNKSVWQGQIYVIQRVRPEDRGSYTCRASNSVGPGRSQAKRIEIKYSPRKTRISSHRNNTLVRVGVPLRFKCDTDAYPPPLLYTWNNTIKMTDSSQQRSHSIQGNILYLEKVQRADEACYVCRATNEIGTGVYSEPVCIQVSYPPTIPILTLDKREVKEGLSTTISCTVESFPLSELTLRRTSKSNPQSSVLVLTQELKNSFQHTFTVTSADTGFYTCKARNDISSSTSEEEELVVKYRPKDVTVQPKPGAVVKEGTPLTLVCSASSHPEVTSFTWTKITDGKAKSVGKSQNFIIKSVSPSDSGKYSCEANNDIGTGKSQDAEIIVKYAPKLTKIKTGEEKQLSDGRRLVTLSCVSHSFPEVNQYSWYKKKGAEERDEQVSEEQTHTVLSDNPGTYYCIAKNEINGKASEPIQLFVGMVYWKILIFVLLPVMLLFLICFLVYRHKKSKPIRQRNSNSQILSGSLGWWIGSRGRGFMNEPVTAEPFRSRDDLLPDQPCRSKGQRRQQPPPDSIPASNISTVYCTVNLPATKQGPSGEMPAKQKARHTQDESLNYASLHFEKKDKNKAEKDALYAVVSRNKKPTKPSSQTEDEKLADYENVRTTHAAKSPSPLDYTSSETSEDEVELNYSKVSFKAKPGHQPTDRDSSTSSTSSEEEIQYSDVKF